MKRLRYFFTAVFVAAASVHAGSKPKASSPASKATPDPTKDPIIHRILSDLQPSHPHLTAKEIVQTSNADLRKMYVNMYTQQGMKLMEAKEKAAAVPLKN